MTLEEIAKIAHEVNKAYCEAIGDTSQPSWENAPDWQKTSAINGVEYALNNPNVTPEEMHQNWYNTKTADGWVYGAVKDAYIKTHPCMLPYNRLPREQKVKDSLFRAVVFATKSIEK